MVVMPVAKQIEHREPLPIDDNRLTVNDTGPRRQRRHRGDDLREANRKIVAVAGEQPDAVALAPRQDAKAVVLDFMNPTVAGGRRVCPSRKTGLN